MVKPEASSWGSIPGPDEEIDLGRVERELAALWAAAAPDDSGAETAVLRACAINLLVLGNSHADLERIRPVAEATALEHPSRILLLAPETRDEGRGIGARISTFCHRLGDGSRHVCCEEITVLARGSATGRLPEAVLPLLLPDLPVYLWLGDPSPGDPVTLGRLTELTDAVIWSARLGEDQLEASPGRSRAPVGVDLDWIRLAPWRELSAQFFDPQERRPLLDRLAAVEVVVAQPPTDRPGAGWLWLGWLASRLGWRMDQKPQGVCVRVVAGRTGPVTLRVSPCPMAEVAAGEPVVIRLQIADDSELLVLERHHSPDPTDLSISESSGRCVHLGVRDEATLLGEALSGVVRDPVYEAAWEAAVRLWGGE